MKDRLEVPTLSCKIRLNIEKIVTLDETNSDTTAQLMRKEKKEKKRSMCRTCPYQKRRMTKSTCDKCEKPICGEHKVELCTSCSN